MEYYEIAKYNPSYYKEGRYEMEDWTSRSDIGKSYNGIVFSLDDYLNVEKRYIQVIINIAQMSGCKYLTISNLEIDKTNIVSDIENSHFYNIDKELEKTALNLFIGKRISINKINEVVMLCLREYAYIRLRNISHKLDIDFGYDYYLYIGTILPKVELSNIIKQEKLYLNPR